MIQGLLDSKYDSLVISFLLLAPPRSFSARELSVRLGIPERKLGDVLHELSRLTILKSFSKGSHKYYAVDYRHKLLPDIQRSLLKNQQRYEDELFSAIKKLGEIRAAFLSGVFTGQPQLPVDLLLVGKINLSKLEKFLDGCKKMMGQDINYSIMTEEEFTIRRDTFDRFIKDVFDYPHIVVVDTMKPTSKKK